MWQPPLNIMGSKANQELTIHRININMWQDRHVSVCSVIAVSQDATEIALDTVHKEDKFNPTKSQRRTPKLS